MSRKEMSKKKVTNGSDLFVAIALYRIRVLILKGLSKRMIRRIIKEQCWIPLLMISEWGRTSVTSLLWFIFIEGKRSPGALSALITRIRFKRSLVWRSPASAPILICFMCSHTESWWWLEIAFRFSYQDEHLLFPSAGGQPFVTCENRHQVLASHLQDRFVRIRRNVWRQQRLFGRDSCCHV